MNTSYYEEKYIEYLEKREEELLRLPMPKTDREAYLLYFKTGNRLEYEKTYFSRREYLTVFGMTSVIFQDRRPDRIFDIIDDILSEPTWVLPPHGTIEHIEGKKHSIDLFAAETAGAISEIIYLMTENKYIYEETVNKRYLSLCLRFLTEVKKRIFDVFLSKRPCDWWENAAMNWSAVCSGNVAIAAYYVKKLQYILKSSLYNNADDNIFNKITDKQGVKSTEKSTQEIISNDGYNEIINRVTDSMVCYLSSMGKDGVCAEGAGYYKYGMEYFLKFYEILRDENRQENIDKIGDFHNTALFLQRVYLGEGNSVNFSDCLLKNKMKMGMACMFSSIYDDVRINEDFAEGDLLKLDTELMEILGGEECHRWLGAFYDYIWVKAYGERLKKEGDNKADDGKDESFTIFKDTQWYIKRQENVCFYIKGGYNDESHNHNDVGSFGLILDGEEILCDLGSGEYTKNYFGEGRYDILCNSSKGHNVPVIDGLYQKAGKIYGADEFCGDEKEVIISFGGAYAADKSYTVKRKIVFKDKGNIFICDHIEGADKISERLISRIKPEIHGNTVLLTGKKSKIQIEFAVTDGKSMDYERVNKSISIIEETHINHSGGKERVYIICCDYICDEDSGNKSGKKTDAVIKLFSNTA